MPRAERDDVFKELLNRVQKLWKAFSKRPAGGTPPAPVAPTTEVAELASKIRVADAALAGEVADLARRAEEDAKARRAELAQQHETLVTERGDVDHRREEFAACIEP